MQHYQFWILLSAIYISHDMSPTVRVLCGMAAFIMGVASLSVKV